MCMCVMSEEAYHKVLTLQPTCEGLAYARARPNMSRFTTAPYALLCAPLSVLFHANAMAHSERLALTQTISLLGPHAKGQQQCVLLLLACQGHVWRLDRRVLAGAGADCLDRQGDRGDAARNSTNGDQVVEAASLVGLLLVRLCCRHLCAYSRTRDTDCSEEHR